MQRIESIGNPPVNVLLYPKICTTKPGLVKCGFLVTNKPNDHIMNRVAGWLGSTMHSQEDQTLEFSHVELIVDDLSSSVYQSECVSLCDDKSFANPAYVFISFMGTTQQKQKIYDFVNDTVLRRVKFDFGGMLASLLPVNFRTPPTDRTFCSRYVTEALQSAGIVPHLDPSITSPTKLYLALRNDKSIKVVMDTVPFKQQLLLSTKVQESFFVNM
jgi:hypothetical protein